MTARPDPTPLKMDPQIRARWVAALRSGEYEQGVGGLHKDGKFCCLGVLCSLAADEKVTEPHQVYEGGPWYYGGHPDYLPAEVTAWAGLGSDIPHVEVGDGHMESLSALNDGGQATFAQIAALIEGGAS